MSGVANGTTTSATGCVRKAFTETLWPRKAAQAHGTVTWCETGRGCSWKNHCNLVISWVLIRLGLCLWRWIAAGYVELIDFDTSFTWVPQSLRRYLAQTCISPTAELFQVFRHSKWSAGRFRPRIFCCFQPRKYCRCRPRNRWCFLLWHMHEMLVGWFSCLARAAIACRQPYIESSTTCMQHTPTATLQPLSHTCAPLKAMLCSATGTLVSSSLCLIWNDDVTLVKIVKVIPSSPETCCFERFHSEGQVGKCWQGFWTIFSTFQPQQDEQ